MSTAWYRPNAIPKLIRRWEHSQTSTGSSTTGSTSASTTGTSSHSAVEVWDTTCIVTNFQAADLLLNPANPSLSGVSKFPYFPKGGPEPTTPPGKDAHPIMGYVTQWGGMEVGHGMMFAANVVDGLVHQLGGKDLQRELHRVGGQCPEGQAVWTPATGELSYYRSIVHTVPPFYGQQVVDESNARRLLADCYRNSMQLIQEEHERMLPPPHPHDHTDIRIASPLLGAGCRGFPPNVAMDIAASTMVEWCWNAYHGESIQQRGPHHHHHHHMTLAFAIPSGELRESLIHVIDHYWEKGRKCC